MGFQKQVYTSVASGVAGDPATPDQAIYQAVNYTAETAVTVGNFVFAGTDPGTQAKASSESDAPIGLVQRNISYVNSDITSAGTLVVPAGSTLTVAVFGDFYVKTKSAATVGQAVYASLTDGSISTAAAGSTVSGSIETAWRVKTAGAANDTIIISNWRSIVGGSSASSGVQATIDG